MKPMILRVVVAVTLVVASTTAAIIPDAKKPDDTKASGSSYQYNYKVHDDESDAFDGPFNGEFNAGARYFGNSKLLPSSRNVKYIADEWGYQPLVKYDHGHGYHYQHQHQHQLDQASPTDGADAATTGFTHSDDDQEKAVKNLEQEQLGKTSSEFLKESEDTTKDDKIIHSDDDHLEDEKHIEEKHEESDGSSSSSFGLGSEISKSDDSSFFTTGKYAKSPYLAYDSGSNHGVNHLSISSSSPHQYAPKDASESLDHHQYPQPPLTQSEIISALDNGEDPLTEEEYQLTVAGAHKFGQKIIEHPDKNLQTEESKSLEIISKSNADANEAPDIIVTKNEPHYAPPVLSYVTKDGKKAITSSYPQKPAVVLSYRVYPTTQSPVEEGSEDDSASIQQSLNEKIIEQLRKHFASAGQEVETSDSVSISGESEGGTSVLSEESSSTAEKEEEKEEKKEEEEKDDEEKEDKPYQFTTHSESDDEEDKPSTTPSSIKESKLSYLKRIPIPDPKKLTKSKLRHGKSSFFKRSSTKRSGQDENDEEEDDAEEDKESDGDDGEYSKDEEQPSKFDKEPIEESIEGDKEGIYKFHKYQQVQPVKDGREAKEFTPIEEYQDEPPAPDNRNGTPVALGLQRQYVAIAPVLGITTNSIDDKSKESGAQGTTAQESGKPSNDEIVEILRSIEIYQSSPGQELFYMPVAENPQVQTVDYEKLQSEYNTQGSTGQSYQSEEEPKTDVIEVEKVELEEAPATSTQEQEPEAAPEQEYEYKREEPKEEESEDKEKESEDKEKESEDKEEESEDKEDESDDKEEESEDKDDEDESENKKKKSKGKDDDDEDEEDDESDDDDEESTNSEKASSNKPIYVVPPQTYALKDRKNPKTDLLLEKVKEFNAKRTHSKNRKPSSHGKKAFFAFEPFEDEQSENDAAESALVVHRVRPTDLKFDNKLSENKFDFGSSKFGDDKKEEESSFFSSFGDSKKEDEKPFSSLKFENNFSENKPSGSGGFGEFKKEIEFIKPPGSKPGEEIIRTKVTHPIKIPDISIKTPGTTQIHIGSWTEGAQPVSTYKVHPNSPKTPEGVPLPIEKIIEKAINIPLPLDKVFNKKPFPSEIEKLLDRDSKFPKELAKLFEKPVVHTPYGSDLGLTFKQLINSENSQGLLSNIGDLIRAEAAKGGYNGVAISSGNDKIGEVRINRSNYSQAYNPPALPPPSYSSNYEGPPPSYTGDKMVSTKRVSPYLSHVPPPPPPPPGYSTTNGLSYNRRSTGPIYRSARPDDYVGPVPPFQPIQRALGFQSKASYPPVYPVISRKPRNHEPPVRFHKGNFRQSKIEYGFKPPMVPSVQYDEETASKVES